MPQNFSHMVRVSAQLVLLAVSCVLLLLLVAAVAKIVPTREHIGSRHAAGHASEEARFGLSRAGSPMASEFSHEGGSIGGSGLFAISMAGPRAPSSLEPAPYHPPTPYHPPKPIQPVTPLTPLGPTPISPAAIPAPGPLSPQTPTAPDPPPPPPGWDIGGGWGSSTPLSFSILVGRDRAKKAARAASPPKHISVLERQSRLSKLALPPWWQRSFGGYPWWHWYWYYPAYALKLVKDEPTYCSWCRQCLAGGGGDACESCLDHCGGQPRFFSLGQ